MSTNEHDHDTENVAPIKTPRQLITAVLLGFIVPVVLIALLTMYVGAGKRPGYGSDALSAESIESRIRPVAGFELRDASGPAVLRAGEEVYKGQCAACHAAGVAGAPKFGDTSGWAPRLGQGFEKLWEHALKGKGAMPPQAGGEYNDTEIGRAVVYLANNAGAKFAEPKAPAQAAGAAASAGGAASAPAATAAAAPAASTSAAVAAAAPAAAAASAAGPMAAATPAAAASGAAGAGKAIYESACVACHGAGVAGAPKVGDPAAWAARIKEGMPHLYEAAIKGKGAMPPKGGKADASDADIKAAVDYMVAASK